MSAHIDYYFSMLSPWAYIGHGAFHSVVSRYDVEVSYKPVKLFDLFSASETLPVGKRHVSRRFYRMVELQRWREKRGLSFHLEPRHWPFSVAGADCMVIALISRGESPVALMGEIFSRIWEREEDLSSDEVLISAADCVGLDGASLLAEGNASSAHSVYESNSSEAISHNVFGVPAYLLNGEYFWGQDRLDLLDDALSSGRVAFSSSVT